jgi:hypothetical protein
LSNISRALTSAACLARSEDRARLCLSPIRIQRSNARSSPEKVPTFDPTPAYPTSHTRCMTATPSSPPAAASACIASASISQPCSPVSASASRRSTTVFSSSASCTTISASSISNRKPCNPSTTPSAQGCHPCLRYVFVTYVSGPDNGLFAGGRRIRTRGPSAKGKAMGSHSRQALPSRA